MNTETLQSALAGYFAPWVQALDLRVEGFDGDSVTLSASNDSGRSARSCTHGAK